MTLHDLSCVAHVHSTHSDGTATVPEIAADARAAGAQAVLVTDHDALAPGSGWHDGVLVLSGVEVSLRRGAHFLAFGIPEPIRHRGLDAAGVAAAVAARGGFGFAAHPFAHGRRSPGAWPALDAPGVTGLELWNVASDVVDGVHSPLDVLRFLRNPDRTLDLGPPAANLAGWDRLCARRRIAALGGVDAHQLGVRIAGRVLSPMPNRRWFGWLRTHLLLGAPPTGELEHDAGLVLEALREGRAWLHRPPAGPAAGARLWLERDGEPDVPMGAETAARPGRLRLALPRAADVRVLRDGTPIADERGVSELALDVSHAGAHRVEARIDGRVWLLSNPVYLRADWPVSQ
ncbi:MAG: hypothetical protein QOI62_3524 [Solirubrobacteraceae bacterium]|jgi:hypothetical protein|nr:hypothetical protein [Solirubrobacteraceae bacterium]MEA2278792.1 hypothetical protein [Solirubrobacteraceae bacterium]MEA2360264.1 hypothetical protein [Solirubrobacteraceae bacterium]MEA2395802.1 hypothetical protein [Solirubrobacteraceae bacterium]